MAASDLAIIAHDLAWIAYDLAMIAYINFICLLIDLCNQCKKFDRFLK